MLKSEHRALWQGFRQLIRSFQEGNSHMSVILASTDHSKTGASIIVLQYWIETFYYMTQNYMTQKVQRRKFGWKDLRSLRACFESHGFCRSEVDNSSFKLLLVASLRSESHYCESWGGLAVRIFDEIWHNTSLGSACYSMLPAELIDLIFSFLQENTLALKACSKVHPLFSRLAERHIYAHIVSDSHFCQDIIENPHLLNYPRTLEIHPLNQPLKSIMSVIPRMANLVSLRINNPYLFGQRLEFHSALKTASNNHPFRDFTSPISFVSHFLFSTMQSISSTWQYLIAMWMRMNRFRTHHRLSYPLKHSYFPMCTVNTFSAGRVGSLV